MGGQTNNRASLFDRQWSILADLPCTAQLSIAQHDFERRQTFSDGRSEQGNVL